MVPVPPSAHLGQPPWSDSGRHRRAQRQRLWVGPSCRSTLSRALAVRWYARAVFLINQYVTGISLAASAGASPTNLESYGVVLICKVSMCAPLRAQDP